MMAINFVREYNSPGIKKMKKGAPGSMKKIGYAFGALACLVGLFYFILMLTR